MAYSTIETDTTARINQVLNDFFEKSISEAAQISPSYRQLWQSLHDLIRSGGKRLRPQMTLLAYEAFGGKDTGAVLPVATAQELLHLSLLVHDDIIDRDYIRYGAPNIAGQYRTLYAPFVSNPDERTHYANSAAILGGDLLLSAAHQMIADSTLPARDKLQAQVLLARNIFEVAAGELLDTESVFVPYVSGDALKIARYKTAGYSFIGPLTTGACLAGALPTHIDMLRTYAESLGVAFQLVDDMLGMYGVEEVLGKTTTGDIREGKRTYMAEQATSAMSPQQKETFDRIYGNAKATPDEIAEIRELFIVVGAKQSTDKAIAEYADKARKALSLLPLDDDYLAKFEQLITKVTNRSF